ncbi:hypothetical protein JXI42_13620, partial [bacterium]|nr:hypothetical protein [bacterium]
RVDGSTGWKTETIILPDSMSTRPTIYLSLKFISDYGNNVYIDNLIVTGVAFDTLELARICDGDGYFYGDVTANSFIGNGSNLTGLDDLDWSKNGNYLFPFNTSDSVVIGGTTAYDKLDVAGSMTIRGDNLNLPHGNTLVSNLESIRMAGVAADYIISLQDGSGRIQHYWNSTTGNPGPNRYLATGEPAWMWDVTVFADPYMEFKYAPADTEGHDITWITHMAIESSGNIGIGTTTPSEKLDVFGKTRTTDFQMTGGATDGFVLQSDPAGNASWVDPESLAIENDGDWTLSGTDMYSAVSGNVGVGISEPAAKLHVAVDNCDSVSSPPFQDGFEDGTLAPFTADAHPWFVTSESVSEGTKSARSGGITDNQITNMELTLTTEPGRISFDRRVFSEPNADYLRFYIDGVLKDSWAGDLDWYSYSYPVTGGSHTFRWSYQKDISDAWYYDCAWIDNVQCIDTTYEIDCASDYALYADGKNLTPAGIFINGNMGIGTTTPSTQLDVIGDAIFSGMVGVGTSSPSTQLDVNGNAVFSGKVGVGTSSPDPSAALDISSTSSGFVIPRLTTAQRDAIANPTQSLMVYNTTTKCLQIWENNFEWYDIWCVPPWVGVCGENTIIDVTNPATGDTWMDRNLGASRQATAYNDYMAYGALFQWGRLSDGHECINWTSSSAGNPVNDSTHTTSSTDDPGHSLFIATGFPNDWRVPRNDLLWRGIHGINNPCPPGYRLPTETELDNELLSWSASGPYGSPLKLVSAGERFANDSDLHYTGYNGSLWSSTTSEVSVMVLHFEGSTYLIASSMRGHGRCVRCIKD